MIFTPILIPLAISVVIFTLLCFGHLSFKNIQIAKVSMVMAIFSIPFSLFFKKILEAAYFDLDILLLSVELLFVSMFAVIVIAKGIVGAKQAPSIVQMIGPFIMCAGIYFLLA